MKPGGPLQRRTPLTGGKGPQRKAGIRGQRPVKAVRDEIEAAPAIPRQRAGTGRITRTPKPRPAPKATGPSLATLGLVHLRDAGRCVRCLAVGANTHHREPRGMGGRRDPAELDRINNVEYLLWLCGSGTTGCHGWVESNRRLARAQGYLLRRNAARPAADVPVLTALGWQLFTTDGRRIPTSPPEETP